MDEDDFDRNSDGDRGYRNNSNEKSRRQLEKRPARRVEDDFDDDELFAEMRTDAGDKERRRTQAQGQSKKPYKGTGGSGAEARRARMEEEDDMDEDDEERGPTFRLETLHGVFKDVWTDPATRVQRDALEMSGEFLRLFTIEALHRTAAYQREQEDEELKDVETLVELDSLEAIAPQLVMDF
ncbi:hypothetical protein EC957_011607 [Mortierella hygrophila]|uniref:Centromere protein X n=1 Tax=Mortierella hygrophila TaxID=979708 RepID=A0A9P6F8F5_9FUNG|nr:hypothetical protein EC957_011607 [Mortierella hygrophila]